MLGALVKKFLGCKTLHIQSLSLLLPEVQTGPVVRDEARGQPGPALLHFLKTSAASESTGVRDVFRLKSGTSGLKSVSASKLSKPRKPGSLGTGRLSPRDPNKLSVRWEKSQPGRQSIWLCGM